jgi:hypothetical protein
MDGYWRVAERGVDESPYRAGFAQIFCVAESDAEAERLYAPHILYFFNRCLHVYPGFADAPGYRTIKTLQANVLPQFTPKGEDLRAYLEGPRRGRLRDRREPGHGARAHARDDPRPARGKRLLSAPHGRHA